MEKKTETWSVPTLERISVAKLTKDPPGSTGDSGAGSGKCDDGSLPGC